VACCTAGASLGEVRETSAVYLKVFDTALDGLPPRLINAVRTPTLNTRSPAGILQRLCEILIAVAEALAPESNDVSRQQLTALLASRNLIMLQDTPTSTSGTSSSGISPVFNDETSQLLFILAGALTLLYVPGCGASKVATTCEPAE
jgi:hypothetical protein